LVLVGPLADSNAVYYYHYDALGSVVALSDAGGDTVQTYEYSVYGQVAAEDPNHPNPYMFTGRRFDIEIGLYYYRARYYNPFMGRFLQTDPVGYDDGMNLYAYCRNDPLNATDPNGLESEEVDAVTPGWPLWRVTRVYRVEWTSPASPGAKLWGELTITFDVNIISNTLLSFGDPSTSVGGGWPFWHRTSTVVGVQYENSEGQQGYKVKARFDWKGHKIIPIPFIGKYISRLIFGRQELWATIEVDLRPDGPISMTGHYGSKGTKSIKGSWGRPKFTLKSETRVPIDSPGGKVIEEE